MSNTATHALAGNGLSIVTGAPLDTEPGLGTLTIAGYVREITQRYGAREALVIHTPEGVVRWTYSTLWERSVEVARALLAIGVGKDSRVGILMTNRPEFLASMFGIALAGAVCVTLSTFSTPPELEYLLQSSCVSVLLFENRVLKKGFGEVLCELEPAIADSPPGELLSRKFPFLRRLVRVDATATTDNGVRGFERWGAFLRHGDRIAPPLVEATSASVKPSDTGILFFSSGTTSLPKGIFHSQRAVAIQWWRWPAVMGTPRDVRCWTANGFFWSGNLSMVLGCGLSTGGTIVLQATFQPEQALELMAAERVTMPMAWPHQWAKLEGASNWSEVDLSSLLYADPVMPFARHPTVKLGDWFEPPAYGTTETLTIVASMRIRNDRVSPLQGPPLPGNTIKIVDPVSGAIVAQGERGEIAVKGPTLMLGYIGIPMDEILDAEGFLHTGDSGYLDEHGRLYWEGRLTDMIKTGGANVSPLEIDSALASYPGVKISRTVGVPDATLGEMVVSCIVPHEGTALSAPAVREYLKERLASFKVPRQILFLREEDLSMTGSEKVRANALIKLAAERLRASPG
jgi:fatty-acyl-CoA synthase